MTDMLAVTQEDREAAADLFVLDRRPSADSPTTLAFRQGNMDHHCFTQAFARHRLDTRPTPAAVGGDDLSERLSAVALFLHSAGRVNAARDVRKAIAALAQPQRALLGKGGVSEAIEVGDAAWNEIFSDWRGRTKLAEDALVKLATNTRGPIHISVRRVLDQIKARNALSNPPSEEMTRCPDQ